VVTEYVELQAVHC